MELNSDANLKENSINKKNLIFKGSVFKCTICLENHLNLYLPNCCKKFV